MANWAAALPVGHARLIGNISTENGRLKISPLADWSREDVEAYTRDTMCPAIPCTRRVTQVSAALPAAVATEPGEDERAGRWWWETGVAKECGLHFSPDGRAMRTVDVLIREILENSNAA